MNIKTKKGALNLYIIVAMLIAFLVIGGIALAKSIGGDTVDFVDTWSPKKPGCNPKPLKMKINGEIDIKDGRNLWNKLNTNIFNFKPRPEPEQISNINYMSQQLAIFNRDFNWKVCPINPSTGSVIGVCDKGDGLFKVVDGYMNKIQKQDFMIYAQVPDQNCNGVIDEDFDVTLRATVSYSDEEKSITHDLSFIGGVLQR